MNKHHLCFYLNAFKKILRTLLYYEGIVIKKFTTTLIPIAIR